MCTAVMNKLCSVVFAETGSSALSGCDRVVRLPAHSVCRLHLLCPGNIRDVTTNLVIRTTL